MHKSLHGCPMGLLSTMKAIPEGIHPLSGLIKGGIDMARGRPSPISLILIGGLLLLLGVTILISAQPPEPRIVFQGLNWKRERFWNIYTMDLNGGETKQLTNNPWHDARPDWSPDGRKIAFYSGWDLAIMNWDGSNCRRLNTGTSLPQDPDWSPDGKKIAFAALGVGGLNKDIYVLDLQTGKVRNLTCDLGEDTSPSWSPDGRWIAFESDRDPRFWDPGGARSRDIYIMDSEGGNLRNITQTKGLSEAEPSWSPDGTQIAFTVQGDLAHTHSNIDIYLMDTNGGSRRKVTDFKDRYPVYTACYPSWSSDGQHILFALGHVPVGDEEGGQDLCMIGRDGRGFRMIYHKSGFLIRHPDMFGGVVGVKAVRLKKTLWGVIKSSP